VRLDTAEADSLSLPGKNYILPTYGPGGLTVRASLIDIGNLSLQNTSAAYFLAEGGEIRGNGALNATGLLLFAASQIC
jgi:hypothetical protein